MNYIHDISGKQFCGYDDKPFLKAGKQKCGLWEKSMNVLPGKQFGGF